MYWYFCDDKHENIEDNEIILQCASSRFDNIIPEKDSLINIGDELWHVNGILFNYASNKQVSAVILMTRVSEIKAEYETRQKMAEERANSIPKDINEYVEREFLFNEK